MPFFQKKKKPQKTDIYLYHTSLEKWRPAEVTNKNTHLQRQLGIRFRLFIGGKDGYGGIITLMKNMQISLSAAHSLVDIGYKWSQNLCHASAKMENIFSVEKYMRIHTNSCLTYVLTHRRCGWWPQTGQSSWQLHCPSLVSLPQPERERERERDGDRMRKDEKRNGQESLCKMMVIGPRLQWLMFIKACVFVYLVHLVCGRVFANSDSERGFIGHGYSQLHIRHAIIVLVHEKERQTVQWVTGRGLQKQTKIGFSILPHLIQTETPAWCHFLQWPVQSTLQIKRTKK